MSYCLNPNCPKPDDPLNAYNPICRHCGSWLVLQKRYRVKNLLGEGGFGKTFEIVDDQSNAKVLKVLIDKNPKAVSLFKREAQVLGHLEHPGIPRVAADGYFTYLPRNSDLPLHCLVMEKIEGSNLQEWLYERDNQPILQEQALSWLKQLTEILHQVHEQQYFHRDIKPSNIMLRPTGQLVLIDFGSVREVTRTYLAKAVGGGQKGTGIISPGYTPPEQANGKSVPQSDFFALGRTFVFLLTGKDPNDFPENPRTGELIWRNKAIDVSSQFADLIDLLMAPFPGNRPQNTRAILQRIAELERPMPEYAPPPPPPRNANYRGNVQSRPTVAPLTLLPRSKRRRGARRATYSYQKPAKFNFKPLIKGAIALLIGGGAIALLLGAGMEIYRYLAPQLNQLVGSSAPTKTSPNSSPLGAAKKASLTSTLATEVAVNAIAISPDGQTIASGNVDKTVKIWNLQTGKVIYTLSGHKKEIWAIAISPDGKTLASGSGDKTIKLWDIGSGQLINTLNGHSDWVLSVAFSPDGKTLASGSADRTIKLWDVGSGKAIRTLNGHIEAVNAIAFSPRSPQLASASEDNTIQLWDLGTGQMLNTLYVDSQGVRSIAFSLDGQTLASGGGDGSLYLWDVATSQVKSTMFGHSASVNAVVFSPDGKTLVSGGSILDSTIKLWNRNTGQLLQKLNGHSDTIRAVAISPDGRTLFSGSEDKTIKIWQMP